MNFYKLKVSQVYTSLVNSPQHSRHLTNPSFNLSLSNGLLDGASQGNLGLNGVGDWLMYSFGIKLEFRHGHGIATNNKEKLATGLDILLDLAWKLGIMKLTIYGNS